MNSKSLLLVGSLYARPVGAAAAFLPLMNGKLEISQGLDTQKIANYERIGGGDSEVFSRIKEVTGDMELFKWDKRNWALAHGAPESAIVASGAVADEVHVAYVGGMVRLNHIASAITGVKDDAGVALVANTDYKVVPGGVVVLEGGAVADGDSIKVSYTKASYINLEALTKLDTELECYFVGQNENDGGKLVTYDIWRMYVPPSDKLALMGDKLQSLKLKTTLLADTTKGVGEGAFFRPRVQV